MHLFTTHQPIPEPFHRAIVSIGNYDGVHRGHQEILKKINALAAQEKTKSAVITFEPHPLSVLHPQTPPFRVSTAQQKREWMQIENIDALFETPFTHALIEKTAEEFVEDILVKHLNIHTLVVGDDFHFGKNRTGNIALLEALSKTFGFTLYVIPEVMDGAVRYSSTAARRAIQEGDMQHAASILGRPFTLQGDVVHGDQKGRELGFPTANLELGDYVRPKFGVYAVRVTLENTRYEGVANIGIRPTFQGLQERCEVHIFHAFHEPFYGTILNVELLQFVRAEQKFETLNALKAQIAADIEFTQRFFLSHNA